MGQATISIILDVAVIALLVPTIVFAVVLNGRLAVLRRNREDLSRLVAAFNEATQRAEAGIPKLKRASDDVARSLQEKVDRAHQLRDDLAFMVERAEAASGRMDSALRGAKVDLSRPDVGRSDFSRPEMGRPEVAPKSEIAKVEQARMEALRAGVVTAKTDPAYADLTTLDAGRTDSFRPDGPRPDGPRPNGPRPEPTRPEQARPEQARPEQARPEQARPESTRLDPTVRADAALSLAARVLADSQSNGVVVGGGALPPPVAVPMPPPAVLDIESAAALAEAEEQAAAAAARVAAEQAAIEAAEQAKVRIVAEARARADVAKAAAAAHREAKNSDGGPVRLEPTLGSAFANPPATLAASTAGHQDMPAMTAKPTPVKVAPRAATASANAAGAATVTPLMPKTLPTGRATLGQGVSVGQAMGSLQTGGGATTAHGATSRKPSAAVDEGDEDNRSEAERDLLRALQSVR